MPLPHEPLVPTGHVCAKNDKLLVYSIMDSNKVSGRSVQTQPSKAELLYTRWDEMELDNQRSIETPRLMMMMISYVQKKY